MSKKLTYILTAIISLLVAFGYHFTFVLYKLEKMGDLYSFVYFLKKQWTDSNWLSLMNAYVFIIIPLIVFCMGVISFLKTRKVVLPLVMAMLCNFIANTVALIINTFLVLNDFDVGDLSFEIVFWDSLSDAVGSPIMMLALLFILPMSFLLGSIVVKLVYWIYEKKGKKENTSEKLPLNLKIKKGILVMSIIAFSVPVCIVPLAFGSNVGDITLMIVSILATIYGVLSYIFFKSIKTPTVALILSAAIACPTVTSFIAVSLEYTGPFAELSIFTLMSVPFMTLLPTLYIMFTSAKASCMLAIVEKYSKEEIKKPFKTYFLLILGFLLFCVILVVEYILGFVLIPYSFFSFTIITLSLGLACIICGGISYKATNKMIFPSLPFAILSAIAMISLYIRNIVSIHKFETNAIFFAYLLIVAVVYLVLCILGEILAKKKWQKT
jgi:hypothetical protein